MLAALTSSPALVAPAVAPTPAHHSKTTSTCALPATNDSTTIKFGCEVCSALHLLLRRAGGMKHTLLALPAFSGICAVVLCTNAVLILVALACVVHAR